MLAVVVVVRWNSIQLQLDSLYKVNIGNTRSDDGKLSVKQKGINVSLGRLEPELECNNEECGRSCRVRWKKWKMMAWRRLKIHDFDLTLCSERALRSWRFIHTKQNIIYLSICAVGFGQDALYGRWYYKNVYNNKIFLSHQTHSFVVNIDISTLLHEQWISIGSVCCIYMKSFFNVEFLSFFRSTRRRAMSWGILFLLSLHTPYTHWAHRALSKARGLCLSSLALFTLSRNFFLFTPPEKRKEGLLSRNNIYTQYFSDNNKKSPSYNRSFSSAAQTDVLGWELSKE